MKSICYTLIDPRTDKIMYVGETTSIISCYKNNLYETKSKAKAKWIKELRKEGLKPKLNIVYEGEDAGEYKIKLINEIGIENLTNSFKPSSISENAISNRKASLCKVCYSVDTKTFEIVKKYNSQQEAIIDNDGKYPHDIARAIDKAKLSLGYYWISNPDKLEALRRKRSKRVYRANIRNINEYTLITNPTDEEIKMADKHGSDLNFYYVYEKDLDKFLNGNWKYRKCQYLYQGKYYNTMADVAKVYGVGRERIRQLIEAGRGGIEKINLI